MAKFLLLCQIVFSCFVLSVFGDEKRAYQETKINPVSHSFQPIHRQPIQQRQPIRRQTVKFQTVIRKPVETKIVRGESKSVIEPVAPVRSVESAPVREVPQPAVQREYGSPEINTYQELVVERPREERKDYQDRVADRRSEYDRNTDRISDTDRVPDRTSDRVYDRVPERREVGLEAALFNEPTTPASEPEVRVTTASPTNPVVTKIDVPIRREPNTPIDPIDLDDEDDEEEEEEEIEEEIMKDPIHSNLDPTEIENGINNRRRDQSPIQTAIDYTKYKPRKRNLREKRLLRLLGEDYDSEWMSFERPSGLRQVQPVGIAYKTDSNLLTALNNLNFTFQSPNGMSFQPPPQLLNVFKDWLIRTAGCPVTFTWHDIGDYYWPRWVKRGECLNETPCSWPPGQQCVPVRSHTVFILRWHCRRTLPKYLRRGRRFHSRHVGPGRRSKDEPRRNRKRKNRRNRAGRREMTSSKLQAESRAGMELTTRIRCRWLKIPYPVIANCFCTCP